jgi:NAD(P)-dependent dehydrogenase (short-subunit alcohol dehydrogenase family)
MEGLADKTVVVTGACGGIGAALLARFRAAGCRLVACDRSRKDLDGIDAQGRIAFDLTDAAGTAAAADAIVQAFGAPDCLVNNAGWTRAETMAEMGDAAIEVELALNLSGVMRFTQGLVPAMARKGGGSVVFVSSVNARMHFGNPAYSAAKAGIEAYSRAIAVEYGERGVRSNAVAPGSTRTPAWDHRAADRPGLEAQVGRLYPLRRMVTPDEVAAAVAFLASPLASGITGATLPVDAGASAGFLPFIDTVLKE